MSARGLSISAWLSDPDPDALGIAGTRLVKQRTIVERRGRLTVGQTGDGLPFLPRRYFVISEVPEMDIRGEHAHRRLHQFLVCLAGSVIVDVDDGARRATVVLDSPEAGVHIPPMVWASQHDYTRDAVLLVMASAEYDAADYIRDHAEFLAAVNAGRR